MRTQLNHSRLTHIVSVLPPRRVEIDSDEHLSAVPPAKIKRLQEVVGLQTRYIAGENTTAADLGFSGAAHLFENYGVDPQEIDGLIFVTQTPDYFQPSVSSVLQGRLGLKEGCATFDINQGCTGFVYGSWLAQMLIETGSCAKVLVMVGDTLSKCVNKRDFSIYPLFGDGVSVCLFERSAESRPAWFSVYADGKGFGDLIIPSGAFRSPKSAESAVLTTDADGNSRSGEDLYMNGLEIFNFAMKRVPPVYEEMLEFSGKSIENIDAVIFHQANDFFTGLLSRKLKIPAGKSSFKTVNKYGNLSGASIPFTICEAAVDGGFTDDFMALNIGFGVGLSWGAALVNLKGCKTAFIFGD